MSFKLHTFAECKMFKEAREVDLTNDQAELMVKKLAKHFKLPIRNVYFRKCVTSTAYKFGGQIKFWHNPDARIVCHEVCHFLCWKKFDSKVRHGTKKWCRQMTILTNYVKKKNYWKQEFERRLAPKPVKPLPTKEELTLKLVARLESNCKRYQTKLKLYGNKLKKAEKKIARLKR